MEGRVTVGAAFYAFSPSSVVDVFIIILGGADADAMSLQHMSGEKSTRRKGRGRKGGTRNGRALENLDSKSKWATTFQFPLRNEE